MTWVLVWGMQLELSLAASKGYGQRGFATNKVVLETNSQYFSLKTTLNNPTFVVGFDVGISDGDEVGSLVKATVGSSVGLLDGLTREMTFGEAVGCSWRQDVRMISKKETTQNFTNDMTTSPLKRQGEEQLREQLEIRWLASILVSG